jgi:hypothetical protein
LSTGEHTDFQAPGSFAVLAALRKYTAIVETEYPYLEHGYDLPDPVPEDLLLPFLEFVQKYGLEDMLNIAFQMGQGYGDFLNVPTLYAMKILSLGLLRNVEAGSLLRMQNNSELYSRAQHEIEALGSLYLSSIVLATSRDAHKDDLTTLLLQTPTGKKRIRTRQILMTIPPSVVSLNPAFSMDDHETSFLSQFRCNWYWAGVMRNAQLPDFEVPNVELTNPGAVPTIPGMYVFEATAAPDIHTFWYGAAAGPANQTEERVRKGVLDTIVRLKAAANQQSGPSSNVKEGDKIEFLAFGDFNPFACMVDSEAIEGGFYRDLYGLQGYRNTWWTGSAFHTHDSSALWEFKEGVIRNMTLSLEKMYQTRPEEQTLYVMNGCQRDSIDLISREGNGLCKNYKSRSPDRTAIVLGPLMKCLNLDWWFTSEKG